jgi:hypothetical protein
MAKRQESRCHCRLGSPDACDDPRCGNRDEEED